MSVDFAFTIETEQLAKGLRPSKRVSRDSKYLTESTGAVGRDNVLSAVDELTRIDTSDITDAFPFPQLFVFIDLVIVCSKTKIYEWVSEALVEKIEVTAESTWSAVDFYGYVYMSNGEVAVVRNPDTGVYTETTDLPTANSILNYNGQVMIGAPGTNVLGVNSTLPSSVFSLTLSQEGSWV